NFYSALEWVFKVYRKAGERLLEEKKLFGVADEGGYWPVFDNIEEVLIFLTETIEQCGLEPLKEVSISLDIAANNFKYKDGYKLYKEQKCIAKNVFKKQLLKWINMFPIISIEDPFAEEDINLFADFKLEAPPYLQIVGDDLVVTNPELIKLAHKKKAINTVLIKPNQIGTISETFSALKQAESLNLHTILSARSGETEDNFISDLSIGWNIKQLKVGSFSRSERLSKWNQCLRVAEELNNNFAMHAPPNLWTKF
ncbi:phosphopyruvate hydratase, partial [Pelagibacteraceae bacterium]|nr:phosphopyruvate hydratase [Pelagibacteraceae bacterium]